MDFVLSRIEVELREVEIAQLTFWRGLEEESQETMRHPEGGREDDDKIGEGHFVVASAINNMDHMLQQPGKEIAVDARQLPMHQLSQSASPIASSASACCLIADRLNGAAQFCGEQGFRQAAQEMLQHTGYHCRIVWWRR